MGSAGCSPAAEGELRCLVSEGLPPSCPGGTAKDFLNETGGGDSTVHRDTQQTARPGLRASQAPSAT
eukprot:11417313-Alexandrium_andersonii.AAC.1